MSESCGVRDENGRPCELAPHRPDTYHRHGKGESVRYWLSEDDDE